MRRHSLQGVTACFGEIAYRLNGNSSAAPLVWYQTAGEGYPCFDSAKGVVKYGYTDCSGVMSYTNGTVYASSSHNYENGICSTCSEYSEPNLNLGADGIKNTADDFFEIVSAGNLYWFGEYVENGHPNANAVLTSDINMNSGFRLTTDDTDNTGCIWFKYSDDSVFEIKVAGDNIGTEDGDKRMRRWTMVSAYSGVFDGAGHTITNLYINDVNKGMAMFGNASGATFRNIGFVNAVVIGYQQSAVLFVISDLGATTTLDCCFATGYVSSYDASRMFGFMNCGSASNCYTIIKTYDPNSYGPAVYRGIGGIDPGPVTITNCYYVREDGVYGDTSQEGDVAVSSGQVFSGELAYMLNGSVNPSTGTVSKWHQTLGESAQTLPLLDEALPNVYYGYVACNTPDKVYTNGTVYVTKDEAHNYNEYDVCRNCGELCPAVQNPVDGYYEISSSDQLSWFRAKTIEYPRINGRLTENIIWYGDFYFGDVCYEYHGTFDGNSNHIETLDKPLFNEISSEGVVKNLKIGGSTIDGYGAICNNNYGLIINCANYSEIGYAGSTAGGICGSNYGTIRNSYNGGKVNEDGYVLCYSNEGTVDNCYFFYFDEETVREQEQACGGIGVTREQLEKGEVAFKLNGSRNEGTAEEPLVWGQRLGMESFPTLGSNHVYYGYVDCKTRDYSNTRLPASNDTLHPSFTEEGFCTVCGGNMPAHLNAGADGISGNSDDVYEIGNLGNLKWLSDEINSKGNSVQCNVILTADINFNPGVTFFGTPEVGYKAVDSEGAYIDKSTLRRFSGITGFSGVFDGAGHSIIGLYASYKYYCNPLFGVINGTATVKNLKFTGFLYDMGGYFSTGGLCHGNNGIIDNCVVSGTIISEDGYATGGVCIINNGTITRCDVNVEIFAPSKLSAGGVCKTNNGLIADCFIKSVEAVVEEREELVSDIGGVCFDGTGKIENCLFTGSIFGTQALSFCTSMTNTVTNCCSTVSRTDSGCEYISNYNIESGYVCCKLNGTRKGDDIVWYQTLSDGEQTKPSFNSTDGIVYKNYTCVDVYYSNTEGSDSFTPHDYSERGICSVCGDKQKPTLVNDGNEYYYSINNEGNFILFFADLSSHTGDDAKLTADLNFGDDFVGIDRFVNFVYSGSFDGNGHTVTGLIVNGFTKNKVALFCDIGEEGSVKNLNIVGARISADGYIEDDLNVGVIAVTNSGTISNCTVKANINAMADVNTSYIGGVCARNEGTVLECKVDVGIDTIRFGILEGSVTTAAGICATNTGRVENCVARGKITSDGFDIANLNGICGDSTGGYLLNCVSFMTFNAVNYASVHICGVCGVTDDAFIENCYYLAGTANDATQYGNIYGTSSCVYGDIDHNGVCDSSDLIMLAQLLADMITVSPASEFICDVDGDNACNAGDLITIAQYLADMIGTFPAENVG